MSKHIYRLGQFFLDGAVAFLSCYLAYLIRFEGDVAPTHESLAIILPGIAIIGRLGTQTVFGLYQQIWRLFGLKDGIRLLYSVTVYSVSIFIITRLIIPQIYLSFVGIPLGVAVIDWSLCLLAMAGLRLARRWYKQKLTVSPYQSSSKKRRVLVIGAGYSGSKIVQEIQLNPYSPLTVMGFLDDDSSKIGRKIEGIKVLGKISEINKLAEAYQIEEVIVAMPSASNEKICNIVEATQGMPFKLKVLPGRPEILTDTPFTNQVRDIQIQDILGRPEVILDFREEFNGQFPSAYEQVFESRVLVTGAGGTIGSEICRQLARLKPKTLLLLGRGENSIFKIKQELGRLFPELDTVTIIADIRHKQRMDTVFRIWQPELVFHAAAHKHVPLMQENPTESLENNVFGTGNLAQLAAEYGVKTFVMISTDKAVNSTNFMGLSKRLAELTVKSLSVKSETRFLIVRFGNVLGSRGSVVPIFKEQIARGGPLTVTHRDMTRYFMTTPEASQLVIQSLAVGKSGQILILDMGEPVKIYDLAQRMIELAGFIPEKDIPIKIVGCRPGEKLHESLVNDSEKAFDTEHPKIMGVSEAMPSSDAWQEIKEELAQAIDNNLSSEELWKRAISCQKRGYKIKS
ncbi:nucleoside-diphosphate sugar epimerase/dehydratase [Crocosphaera sp.]|uniref:nucleoside-diphosphate sugar epimerase/dehydratase n=1 Tax=Crocosphaera sp. TaxID=2729996 RepID=UPI0026302A42|nr:nucleoside-diphosphate sugar epimerase/dehydratase [Crocosphaera sp.]MDJ0578525.1 nucleoside-diphosphate sugar epimerase/dehydratase [Crocosphaera sp.]